ncbi:MAG: GNAT family N-acetyltransferase [Pseudomonadota bacterium]
MKIENPVSNDFWHAVAVKCPWATYFHTPAWAACMARTFPEYTVSGIGYIMEDGTRVVLPAVAREKKRLLSRKKDYKSMEPGVYGGFIAEKILSQDATAILSRYLLAMRSAAGRIVESPFQPLHLSAPFTAKGMFTHVVDLGPEFESIAKRFSRGQKSNINQGRRKGIAVRPALHVKDIECYYDMYEKTVKRWGDKAAKPYPQELFFSLFLQKDPHVRFWLAELDGRVIAGAIVLSWNKNIIYWHGCALQEYFKCYPNNVLHAAILEWGCKNGFQFYDMGPSMELEGVVKFKESFGARKVSFKSYRWK